MYPFVSFTMFSYRGVITTHHFALNCVAFWKRKLNIVINPYFIMASKATTESKLKVLHFKLIHNIYPSNFLLHKMKIKNTNICDYCHEVDFLEHMFVSCQRLKSFWDTIMIIVEYILDQPICMNSTIALFGLLKSSVTCKQEKLNEANHIILLAKFCIVKAKYSPGNQNLHFMFEYELAMRRQYFPTLKENWIKPGEHPLPCILVFSTYIIIMFSFLLPSDPNKSGNRQQGRHSHIMGES